MLTKIPAHASRVVTGLVLAALLVAVLMVSGIYLRIALAVVATLALLEFYCMFWPGWRQLPAKIIGVTACWSIFTINTPYSSLAIVLAAFFLSALAFLFSYGTGNTEARLEEQGIMPLGLLYIPCVLVLGLHLSVAEQFLVVVAAISSDTLAYYVGCLWGKHKIWPQVSPKKSWQGSLGGLAACVLSTVLLGVFAVGASNSAFADLSWQRWLVIGVLLNIAGQLGDFFESALKRTRGTKDSSPLLPGHGGVLDRIDSLLFVMLAYAQLGYLPSIVETAMKAVSFFGSGAAGQ